MTTAGCSLCEKAKLQLWPTLSQHQLKLMEVDIIDYQILLDQFATQIPVIALQDPTTAKHSMVTLSWPFTSDQVELWLSQNLSDHP